MKSKSRIALSILAVGALSLACSLLTAPAAPPVVTQPPVRVEATMPPATEPMLPTQEPSNPSNLPAGLATARDETRSTGCGAPVITICNCVLWLATDTIPSF